MAIPRTEPVSKTSPLKVTTSKASSAEHSGDIHTRSNGEVHEEVAPKHLQPVSQAPLASLPSFPPFAPPVLPGHPGAN